jgi:hypothetical protein
MAYYTSKNQICNLALAHLGSNGTVNDIETPVEDIEIAFAVHYDIIRQDLLRKTLPNFALRRRLLAKEGENPAFGYGFYYEYPQDCLKLLGIGEISDKQNDYVVEADENGNLKIWTDTDADEGMPIRFVYDEIDVSKYTPDFINLFSQQLAAAVAMNVTQNAEAAQLADARAMKAMAGHSALNAQESRPVRVSESRFKQARYTNLTSLPVKK